MTGMLMNRRFWLGGAAAAGLALPFASAKANVPDDYADLLRRLMGLRWRGKSSFKDSSIQGGLFVTRVEMDFQLGSNWDFVGRMTEVANLDDRTYAGTATVWGNCSVNGTWVVASITKMRHEYGDPLPEGATWSTSTGDLRFRNDLDRPGRFALMGEMRDDNDGRIYTIMMIDS
jgi:hypothetical protein